MFRSIFIFLIVCCLGALPVRAEINAVPVNVAVATEVLIPAYQELAEKTKHQHQVWDAACAKPDAAEYQGLRMAYHQVADSWARIFFWNLGPMTLYLRRDRFYHWPERRNSINKSLSALLASKEAAKLEPARFAKASVAVQGLPALERILFDRKDVLTNPWTCAVGKTIAANLMDISHETLKEWQEEVLPRLQDGTYHPDYFTQPIDFLNRVFNEVLTGYTILKDQKILPVLGSSAAKVRPFLAEGRSSDRFMRNLEINLQALAEVDQVIGRFLPEQVAAQLHRQLQEGQTRLKAIGPIKEGLTHSEIRAKIKDFVETLSVVRDDIANSYVEHMGLTMGFNALDGD